MNRILFIQNPIAGGRYHPLDNNKIKKYFSPGAVIDFHTTTCKGDATSFAEEHLSDYDLFVAVGGDGTANEVGKALLKTEKVLTIIPAGSGNGLARELGISCHLRKALGQIAAEKLTVIDTININSSVSLNVAGTGFEAEVAHLFKKYKRRGFISYVKSTFKTLSGFKPPEIEIEVNGKKEVMSVFSISFSNSRQFGNNAYIAPLAGLDDGLIDISIIRPFPLIFAPALIGMLFGRALHRSMFYKVIKTEKATLLNQGDMKWHIDGEPVMISGPVSISINKGSLKVLGG
ncbi:MAG TPA: YegS/Rv2252/BmrU family lipid kinase [Bacteroidales bacterium]|nr:YegS/Rv2252/BmrU family lipid kinase [Bacteroidales bacterium]